MTRTYTPHPDLYEHFTDEERLSWAKNLRETKIEQCFDTMSYGNGTACCLHIWEIYESNGGEWFYADDKSTPHNLENPTHLKSEYLPEELNLANLSTIGIKAFLVGLISSVLIFKILSLIWNRKEKINQKDIDKIGE